MLTANDVARYFLALTEEDVGDGISNLKLQKLVYYAQGFNLALYNRPLFDDPIEAWTHGPVIPNLYHVYKDCGANPLPTPADIGLNSYSDEEKNLLNEVYVVYGQYSAWKLRDLTHEEPTWIEARNRENKIISHQEMEIYFKTLLK